MHGWRHYCERINCNLIIVCAPPRVPGAMPPEALVCGLFVVFLYRSGLLSVYIFWCLAGQRGSSRKGQLLGAFLMFTTRNAQEALVWGSLWVAVYMCI